MEVHLRTYIVSFRDAVSFTIYGILSNVAFKLYLKVRMCTLESYFLIISLLKLSLLINNAVITEYVVRVTEFVNFQIQVFPKE